MKPIQISLFFFVFFLISSCNKNEFEEKGISNSGKLSRVLFSDDLYQEYTYNINGLLLEEKSKHFYSKYNYDINNRISTIDHYVDDRIFSSSSYILDEASKRKDWVSPSNTEKNNTNTYKYENGNLIEIKSVRKNGSINISRFQTNNRNQIINQTFINENVANGFVEFYYDSRGNLQTKKQYMIDQSGKASLSTTTEYEFDNYNNPYKSFELIGIPGIYTNSNNITKETYTLHFEVDSWIQKVQITENKYEYNTKGFPVKVNGIKVYEYY